MLVRAPRFVLCFALLFFFMSLVILTGCEEDIPTSIHTPNLPESQDPFPCDDFCKPQLRGQYDVGVRTIMLVDETRYQNWGSQYRALATEVWYPIEKPAGHPNSIADIIGDAPDWAWFLARLFYKDQLESLLETTTTAWRDTEPLIPEVPWPVIIFSHGHMSVPFQNYTQCEHLASHGFVVIAPTHYDNALFANTPNGMILHNPLSIITGDWARPRDIDFLVGALDEFVLTPTDFFYNLIDTDRIGIFGHSYGGWTSYQVGSRLSKIRSVAPLNPIMLADSPATFGTPLLLLVGDDDQIAGAVLNSCDRARDNYYQHPSNKAFVYMKNSGHYSATDACEILPPGLLPDSLTGCSGEMISQDRANTIMNGYLLAFFSITLKDDDRYVNYMRSNHYEADIDYHSYWEE